MSQHFSVLFPVRRFTLCHIYLHGVSYRERNAASDDRVVGHMAEPYAVDGVQEPAMHYNTVYCFRVYIPAPAAAV